MTTEADLFAEIADERRAFADMFELLTPEQLATPSLCGNWTVKEVGAHLVLAMSVSLPRLVGTMVIKGGSFDRANDALSRKVGRERSGAEIATTIRERATFRFTPPGHGPTAPLTDLLIHGQDVRRPLGIARDFSEPRLRTALDFLAGPRAKLGFVAPKKIAGLRFVATDLDFAAGDGPEVRGTGEALLLAYTGRPVVVPELAGDGAEILASRLR
jgi:uncharacterized protein (TIGR03083 family)